MIQNVIQNMDFNWSQIPPPNYKGLTIDEAKRFINIFGTESSKGAAHFLAHYVEDSDEDETEPWLIFKDNFDIKCTSQNYDIDSVLLSTEKLHLRDGFFLQIHSSLLIGSALNSSNHTSWDVNGVLQPLHRIPNVQIGVCGQIGVYSIHLFLPGFLRKNTQGTRYVNYLGAQELR